MNTTSLLPLPLTSPSPTIAKHWSLVQVPPLPSHRRPAGLIPATCTAGDGSRDGPLPPPEDMGIRFKRGAARRRQRQQRQREESAPPPPAPRKEWEEMSLAEKALELYVGEKGLLFWLNKFSYASIFIVIGAWIMFRFVGPALNLYQLDTQPLAPASLFKG